MPNLNEPTSDERAILTKAQEILQDVLSSDKSSNQEYSENELNDILFKTITTGIDADNAKGLYEKLKNTIDLNMLCIIILKHQLTRDQTTLTIALIDHLSKNNTNESFKRLSSIAYSRNHNFIKAVLKRDLKLGAAKDNIDKLDEKQIALIQKHAIEKLLKKSEDNTPSQAIYLEASKDVIWFRFIDNDKNSTIRNNTSTEKSFLFDDKDSRKYYKVELSGTDQYKEPIKIEIKVFEDGTVEMPWFGTITNTLSLQDGKTERTNSRSINNLEEGYFERSSDNLSVRGKSIYIHIPYIFDHLQKTLSVDINENTKLFKFLEAQRSCKTKNITVQNKETKNKDFAKLDTHNQAHLEIVPADVDKGNLQCYLLSTMKKHTYNPQIDWITHWKNLTNNNIREIKPESLQEKILQERKTPVKPNGFNHYLEPYHFHAVLGPIFNRKSLEDYDNYALKKSFFYLYFNKIIDSYLKEKISNETPTPPLGIVFGRRADYNESVPQPLSAAHISRYQFMYACFKQTDPYKSIRLLIDCGSIQGTAAKYSIRPGPTIEIYDVFTNFMNILQKVTRDYEENGDAAFAISSQSASDLLEQFIDNKLKQPKPTLTSSDQPATTALPTQIDETDFSTIDGVPGIIPLPPGADRIFVKMASKSPTPVFAQLTFYHDDLVNYQIISEEEYNNSMRNDEDQDFRIAIEHGSAKEVYRVTFKKDNNDSFLFSNNNVERANDDDNSERFYEIYLTQVWKKPHQNTSQTIKIYENGKFETSMRSISPGHVIDLFTLHGKKLGIDFDTSKIKDNSQSRVPFEFFAQHANKEGTVSAPVTTPSQKLFAT